MGVVEYVVVKRGGFINLSPLRGWRIGPTSVVRDRPIPNGSRSGDLDLQAWRASDGEGQALALREGAAFFIVARGPVPRVGWGARAMARAWPSPSGERQGRRDLLVSMSMARDRPSPYGEGEGKDGE